MEKKICHFFVFAQIFVSHSGLLDFFSVLSKLLKTNLYNGL